MSNIIYGCRDHSIRSLIHNYQTGSTKEVQIFDQPHLDTGEKLKTLFGSHFEISTENNLVTGLVYLNGFIYSVSRDYSLIKWNVDGSKVKQVNNIHTDWIINIEVMRTKNLIITNSRDGSVKVSDFTQTVWIYLNFIIFRFGIHQRLNA